MTRHLYCLSIEGLMQATGILRENFCLACYTGDYPFPPSKKFGQCCFEGQIA
jgi:amidophosphoribosyltransferase